MLFLVEKTRGCSSDPCLPGADGKGLLLGFQSAFESSVAAHAVLYYPCLRHKFCLLNSKFPRNVMENCLGGGLSVGLNYVWVM